MEFKRVIKYICYLDENDLPTGDIDTETLIYEQLETTKWWKLRYSCYREGKRGIEYENENRGHAAVLMDKLPQDVEVFKTLDKIHNQTIILIRGTFGYTGNNPLDDDFGKRTKIKDRMFDELQKVFDAARERIRNQKEHLDDLLKRYEHLPIKG